MDGLDLNTYLLYQQLQQPFFQPPPLPPQPFFQPPLAPPPHAPMLDQSVANPDGYVAAQACSTPPQPLQIPDGGVWAGSGGVAQGQAWPADDPMMLGDDDAFLQGNDQFAHGGGFPSLQDLVMNGVDLSKLDDAAADSLWASAPFVDALAPANLQASAAHPSSVTTYAPLMVPAAGPTQPGSDSSSPSTQVGAAAESPGLTSQVPAHPPVPDYPMFAHDGGVPVDDVQDLLMSGVDLSQLDEAVVNSLFMNLVAANQVAAHPSMPPIVPTVQANQPASHSSSPNTQVGAAASPPGLTSQTGAYPAVMDYQQPPPAASVDTPQAVPDDETAEVAQMFAVAVRCGDKVSTEWSEEENQVLREGLSRFAGQDNVTRCFNIAYWLANKTVIDVAYRVRWLSDLEKKMASKQAQLDQGKSAGEKVTKGKGTKGATRKNNKYPLSKEVLNSKSAEDLVWDNDRLMDKMEEILNTGQVKNSADYFYYVKMNMDALQNKVKDMSTVMEGLSVDGEKWEVVLKDRHSLAGKDTATAP